MKSEAEIRERLAELENKPGLREEITHGKIMALEWVLEDSNE